MAQLVERDLAKVEAAGSSPVSRSFLLSLKIQGLLKESCKINGFKSLLML